MTAFAGMDVDEFPGLAVMGALATQTNLAFTAYYLHAPSHSNAGWSGNRAALVAQGWGLAPVYVGQQIVGPGSHNVTAAQGALDGQDCAAKMAAEGFSPGSFVYLDLENGAPFVSPQTDYVSAWRMAVESAGWGAGIYCSHAMAATVAAANPTARIWAFEVSTLNQTSASTPFPAPDPSGSGFAGAVIWQRADNVRISGGGASLIVDLDTSSMADPSSPSAALVGDHLQPVVEPAPAPSVPPPYTPPIPLTPSVPQLPPPFTPAPVAATAPTIATVATPARVGATVALTGLVAGATAMSGTHIASVKDLIDLAFLYIVAPVVLGIVVGLATSLAKLLNINIQGAVAQRVLTATENGAMALVSKAQTAADDHGTITTKNDMIAGVLNYANAAVPDAVKAAGLATPAGQAILANLAEAQVQKAVAAIPTPQVV